jgi:hypothetical protein
VPWFLVDDQFPTHPAVLATSLAARGLWVTAGAWSSAHSDDVVPDHVLASFGSTPQLAGPPVPAPPWRAATPRSRQGGTPVPRTVRARRKAP